MGLVDPQSFFNPFNSFLANNHFDPATFPLLLSRNVFLSYRADPNNCCLGSFHSASSSASANGNPQVQTAM
jgi:hypothetical protein